MVFLLMVGITAHMYLMGKLRKDSYSFLFLFSNGLLFLVVRFEGVFYSFTSFEVTSGVSEASAST